MYCVAIFTLSLLASLSRAQEQTCSTELSIQEFRDFYCKSALVFRGRITGGSSAPMWNGPGELGGLSNRFRVAVEELYKGSPPNTDEINISRFWSSSDPCEEISFPDYAPNYIIFANSTSSPRYFSVPSCRHSFPPSCVPEAFRNQLSNDNVRCP